MRRRAKLTASQRRRQEAILNGFRDDWHYSLYHKKRHTPAWSAYYFAKLFQGRDIDLVGLTRVIARSGDIELIYRFMRDIKGVNLGRLIHAILNSPHDDNWKVIKKLLTQFPGLYTGPLTREMKKLQDLEEINDVLKGRT